MKFKEPILDNCSPLEAEKKEASFYRIIKDSKISEQDFIPFTRLYPERIEYIKLCKAHALSLFKEKQNAIEMAKQKPFLGKYIVEVSISKDSGVLHLTNEKTTHHSWWLYKEFDLSKLVCKAIEPIE